MHSQIHSGSRASSDHSRQTIWEHWDEGLQNSARNCQRRECGGQCSQPSSPSVFGEGRDGLQLIVRLFGGARTGCARKGEDRTDYRRL